MNQFLFQHTRTGELAAFPHILEFALKKNTAVQLQSFPPQTKDHICVFYISEGRFEWIINNRHCTLYPGDTVFLIPGQTFGGKERFLDIGTVSWIYLYCGSNLEPVIPADWSRLQDHERVSISRLLFLINDPVIVKAKETRSIFQSLYSEINNQEIGYVSRVNHLLDELMILAARHLSHQSKLQHDSPQSFTQLEQTLRNNLAYQWSVEEMAALVGLGTTAFTEKVKASTGLSPFSYLINIRISEGARLLKMTNVNLTEIAYHTGFYSSQHFSTTFRKLTGLAPSHFRKRQRDERQS